MASSLTEDFVEQPLHAPGDLVWAKMNGYPRWPGMIEDCPDSQEYFMPYKDSENEYHVTFFGDKPQRRWVKASGIDNFSVLELPCASVKHKKQLLSAMEQAKEAMKMSVKERFLKFSFAVRYKGRWGKVTQDDCISRLVRDKPVDEDCPQISMVSKKLENTAELKANTIPLGNQDVKIKNNNTSLNQLADIGDTEDEEMQQPSTKHKKSLDKFNEKQGMSAKRAKISAKSIEKQQSFMKYYKPVKSKLQHVKRKHCLESKKQVSSQQPIEGSNQSQMKEKVNLGDSMFVSDKQEDNQNTKIHLSEKDNKHEYRSKIKIPPFTHKSSTVHKNTEVFSDRKNEYFSPEHRAFREFLDKKYPPLIFEIEMNSRSEADANDNCSNGSSSLGSNPKNEVTFSKNKPVSSVEIESASHDKLVTNSKNGTLGLENEQVNKAENESVSHDTSVFNIKNGTLCLDNEQFTKAENGSVSDDKPFCNIENGTLRLDNEQVNKAENGSDSSGNELAMNASNETTFSKKTDPVMKDINASTPSSHEIFAIDRNETTFPETRKPVKKEENGSSSSCYEQSMNGGNLITFSKNNGFY